MGIVFHKLSAIRNDTNLLGHLNGIYIHKIIRISRVGFLSLNVASTMFHTELTEWYAPDKSHHRNSDKWNFDGYAWRSQIARHRKTLKPDMLAYRQLPRASRSNVLLHIQFQIEWTTNTEYLSFIIKVAIYIYRRIIQNRGEQFSMWPWPIQAQHALRHTRDPLFCANMRVRTMCVRAWCIHTHNYVKKCYLFQKGLNEDDDAHEWIWM